MLPCFFVLAGCAGGGTITSERLFGAAVARDYIRPGACEVMPYITGRGDPQEIGMTIHVVSRCTLDPYFVLQNSLSLADYSSGKSKVPYYKLLAGAFMVNKEAGSDAYFHCAIPASQTVDEDNNHLELHVQIYPYGSFWSTLFDDVFALDFWVQKSQNLEIGDDNDGAFSGAYRFGGEVFDSTGKLHNDTPTLSHYGFRKVIENPPSNHLPFSSWRLKQTDHYSSATPLTYRDSYLKIAANQGDFAGIGEEIAENGSVWRKIPLSWSLNSAGENTPQLRDAYAVSPDGRQMKPLSQKGERDVVTHQLYLPSLSAESPTRNYHFELMVNACGYFSLHSIHYAFDLTKSKDVVGNCENSTWCVGVGS